MKPAKEHKRRKAHKEHKHRKRKRSEQEEPLEQLEALLKVAALGDAAAAAALLQQGGQATAALHYFDAEGRTPLHEASRGGHLEVVQCFLRCGSARRVTHAQEPSTR